jgi:TatD DNase family protein
MRLIDTHSHLYLDDFAADIDDTIQRAVDVNVDRIILPNIDSTTIEPMLKLVEKYTEICFPLIGLHPTHVKDNYKIELERILNQFDGYNYKGIGEIGIDLYWDKTYLQEQIYVFEKQLGFALNRNLPVVIHARDSFDTIFESVTKAEFRGLRGVFHAFTGDLYQAEIVISNGFKLGIGGIVTFKNSNLAEVVESVGMEHIVLETDSPYLAPVPYRGKRNESSYLRFTAGKIAEIKKITIEEVAEITTNNAVQLFGL